MHNFSLTKPAILSGLLLISLLSSGCSVNSGASQPPTDIPTQEPTLAAAPPPITDSQTTTAAVSPKAPWGEFELRKEAEPTGLRKALLWLPNRLLDFIDIFRVDAGAGLGTGAVIRVTSYGQAGARFLTPAMLRVGIFGRDSPVKFEEQSEMGIGPAFKQSDQRNLCKGILGAGLDVVLIGLHLGVCPEEIADFFGGIFTADFMEDDLK